MSSFVCSYLSARTLPPQSVWEVCTPLIVQDGHAATLGTLWMLQKLCPLARLCCLLRDCRRLWNTPWEGVGVNKHLSFLAVYDDALSETFCRL